MYPVVGVSHKAATFFCKWRTNLYNNYRAENNQFKSPSFNGVGTSSHYLTIENQEFSRKLTIKEEIKALEATDPKDMYVQDLTELKKKFK